MVIKYWEGLSYENILLDNITKTYTDDTFGCTFSTEMIERYSNAVEIPKISIAQKGKAIIHEKGCTVERTIAQTLNNRRCSKDYEKKTEYSNTFLIIGNISRLAKK